MSQQKKKGSSAARKPLQDASSDEVLAAIISRMEECPNAEALNDEVIMPLILALEKVCEARGYLMNIYGDRSNITVTTPDDAETIYHLIEEYLDTSALD